MFQAVFVYVKMIKILCEDGGAEILDTVHILVVENLVDNGNWQAEASSLEAEITFRKIQLKKPYAQLTAKEKKDHLRMDEMKYRVADGKARDGIELKDIKYIVPRSAEMIALISVINRND